jgi:uncharacterized protein (TIGR02145 family)
MNRKIKTMKIKYKAMKIKTIIYFGLLTGFLMSVMFSCQKETPKVLPTITSSTIINITSSSATAGGEVTSDGGSSVTVKGVCWGTATSPTISNSKTFDGTGTGSFTSAITGLTAGTTYYVRAYATNSVGTAYGSEVSFKTSVSGSETVTDIDGNVYNTVTIGTQVWMVENLKTTKYRNGDPIANVTDNTAWAALTTGAYCWYNNDATTYKATYGALYNWFAVNTGKLCPVGWHVPTDTEWTTLTGYLATNYGTSLNVAKALAATTNWYTSVNAGAVGNNLGINNSSVFTALPGGYRQNQYIPNFTYIGVYGYWWSSTSTANDASIVWYRYLYYFIAAVGRGDGIKQDGFSVRCVRD